MDRTRVFLAWSQEVQEDEALRKALDIVKRQLGERDCAVYDWSEQQHIRNIGQEIEEQIQACDLMILEGTSGRPNLAFEVGFARCADIPVIVLKQEDSGDLPEDFGAPKYLRYPGDASWEPNFKRFEADLRRLLDGLQSGVLSPGHRELRRARGEFHRGVQQILDAHSGDHAHLYLMDGLVRALSGAVREGGQSVITAHSEYYVRMFNALQKNKDIRVKAIADLTEDVEPFWKSNKPDLSTPVGERIFLIDWRLFFEGEAELSRYIDTWRKELQRYKDYKIYVATKDDIDRRARHPFSSESIGLNLLLIEGDATFGGYRRSRNSTGHQMFVMEHDEHRCENAKVFYNAVLEGAVEFGPTDDFVSLKRAWLTKHRIGHWDPAWTQQTERRPPVYFDRYDQHARCWIPSYNEMISECAAAVAREVLHIRQGTGKPVNLLEIGHGTGSLTARILPWIKHLRAPSEALGDLPPVGHYYAVDRAEQMHDLAREYLGDDVNARVYLLRQIAWQGLRDDLQYDVVFGSLVAHFMLDHGAGRASADSFFTECVKRLRPGGSLVFSDAFGVDEDTGADTAGAVGLWRDSMVASGLSEEYADGFITGNPDMCDAFSFAELKESAEGRGLVAVGAHSIGSVPLFKVLVFRRPAQDASPAT
ncbi:class I SAM-dependent methyltransferase [Actinomadura soli]|uniref:Class I SAM-dependent methyltransferase n=1 Tax=Actinomadura soli TaxID=2508997 RepID=A0A5C4J9T7_9ACTN|nr:class I SAM-dependent methyltransferase [Actinomadura soli]TMQ98041.1 class I SAM-dependent methyltransferase [Actinomadura soli]